MLQAPQHTPRLSGTEWLKVMIRLLWEFGQECWMARNSAVHGATPADKWRLEHEAAVLAEVQ